LLCLAAYLADLLRGRRTLLVAPGVLVATWSIRRRLAIWQREPACQFVGCLLVNLIAWRRAIAAAAAAAKPLHHVAQLGQSSLVAFGCALVVVAVVAVVVNTKYHVEHASNDGNTV